MYPSILSPQVPDFMALDVRLQVTCAWTARNSWAVSMVLRLPGKVLRMASHFIRCPHPTSHRSSSACFLSKLMSAAWSLHGSSLNANLPKKSQETLFLWPWSYHQSELSESSSNPDSLFWQQKNLMTSCNFLRPKKMETPALMRTKGSFLTSWLNAICNPTCSQGVVSSCFAMLIDHSTIIWCSKCQKHPENPPHFGKIIQKSFLWMRYVKGCVCHYHVLMFFKAARVPTAKSIPKTHITRRKIFGSIIPLRLRQILQHHPHQGVAGDDFCPGVALHGVACRARRMGNEALQSHPHSTCVVAISHIDSRAQGGDDQKHGRCMGPLPVATVCDAYENHIRVEVKTFQTEVQHVKLDLDKCLKLGCTYSTNTQKVAWLTLSSTYFNLDFSNFTSLTN